MSQVGVYSAALLALHDHSTLSLGGPLGLIERDYPGAGIVTQNFAAPKSTGSATYVEVKRVRVNEATSGRMDIQFTLTPSAGFAFGRIYINGVAVGTEQSTNNPAGQTFNETIIQDLNVGDFVQIYAHRVNVGATALVTGLTFHYDPILRTIGQKVLVTTLALTAANAVSMTEVL